MLEDTWIHEYNTKLYDEDDNEYDVLGFYILEKERKPNPLIYNENIGIDKFSCVLLNKEININTILYTYKKRL